MNYSNSLDQIVVFNIRIPFIFKTRTYLVFGIQSKFIIRPNTGADLSLVLGLAVRLGQLPVHYPGVAGLGLLSLPEDGAEVAVGDGETQHGQHVGDQEEDQLVTVIQQRGAGIPIRPQDQTCSPV